MKKGVTIISSTAQDIFVDSENKVVKKKKGGPGYFIRQALEDRKVPFNNINKWDTKIELYLTKSGKPNNKLFKGKVVGVVPKFNLPIKQMTEYSIVSTIANEWKLREIKNYKGKLFLDIQGYVRDPKKFSVKKQWPQISSLVEYIYCLKGTNQEVKLLPKSVINIAKKKLLIITDGSNKVKVFHDNKKFEFSIVKVNNLFDYIGAGDTFFGHFVAGLYKGFTMNNSAKIAINKTRIFLENKLTI